MKKVYVQFVDNAVEFTHWDGHEQFALYVGVGSVYGGFLLETGGGATCLGELEDSDSAETIDQINAIISDPATPWEPLDEEDERYIADTLKAWGI